MKKTYTIPWTYCIRRYNTFTRRTFQYQKDASKFPKEIKQFLGLIGYYRKFVPRFSDLVRPLNALMRKNMEFEWTQKCRESFELLKTSLMMDPILTYPDPNLPSTYIGESGRSLGERVKEHFKAPFHIHHHSTTTGHPMDPDQFNIVHKEANCHSRTVKEVMFICMQDPTLNRNLGKYQLPHIWDLLLQTYPTLQCKPTNHPTTSSTT